MKETSMDAEIYKQHNKNEKSKINIFKLDPKNV